MNIESKIEQLKKAVQAKEKVLNGKKMTYQSYQIAIERYNQELLASRAKIDLNRQSIIVFSQIVDTKTANVIHKLTETINNALAVVPLTNEYDIHIQETDNSRSGKMLEVKLLDKTANKLRGLRTSSGTAVAQLVSFIFRIVLISFSEHRKMILVDENFSGFQDTETIAIFGNVLTALAEQEGFQIIMVEHKSELLNVPHIKNIMLRKDNYKDGVYIEKILDANEFSA